MNGGIGKIFLLGFSFHGIMNCILVQMMENYVNTAEWPDTAYEDIANFAISSWAEKKGLE